MSNQQPVNSSQGSYNPWGSVFSGLGNLWMGNQLSNMQYPNAANGAMGYLNQVPGVLQNYYNPYLQQGQQAYGNLNNQYNNVLNGLGPQLQGQLGALTNNPGQVLNQIGQNFHQSPGFQFSVDQATQAANNASAAGGMAGSPQEQQYLAGTVTGMANQNYNNWLGQATGLMGQGLAGEQGMYNQALQGEQGIYNTGFQGSNELAQSLANNLLSQGNLSYAGQNNQNMMDAMSKMGGMGATTSGLGQLFSGLFGNNGTGGSSLASGGLSSLAALFAGL